MRYDCIPSCIYMEPEIASVGLTEAQARERCGDDVKIGRFPLYANGKSLIDGGTDGMMKVILDSKYGEILGVHLFGAHTTEMIAQFATAMQSELTAEEVLETVFPHPSVSEGLGASDGDTVQVTGRTAPPGNCDRTGGTGRAEFGGCQGCYGEAEKETGSSAKGNQGSKDHCADGAGY